MRFASYDRRRVFQIAHRAREVLRSRAWAALTRIVRSPALYVAAGQQRATVICTDSQADGIVDVTYRNWRDRILEAAVPELPLIVFSPASHLPVNEKCTGMGGTSSDIGCTADTGDGQGRTAAARRSENAAEVRAPAAHRAVGGDSAAVLPVGGQFDVALRMCGVDATQNSDHNREYRAAGSLKDSDPH